MGILLLAEEDVVVTLGDFDAEDIIKSPKFLDGVLPNQVYSQNLTAMSCLIEKVMNRETKYFSLSLIYDVV